MKKRSCARFNVPGTTLYYRKRRKLFDRGRYPNEYFPVLDVSRGGANFVCNERLKVGGAIAVLISIPSLEKPLALLARVRWVSMNPEQSYRFITGIAFNPFGTGRNKNSPGILDEIKKLEAEYATADSNEKK